MKKTFILLGIALLLSSCHGAFADGDFQRKNINFTEEDLIGTWKLDKGSYKYLSGEGNFDSIYITFKSNNAFEINNSKELFNRKDDSATIDNFSNGKVDNTLTQGRWKINYIKMPEYTITDLNLVYDNNINQSGLNVYKKGEEYQIWYFFGDPDSGERLRFLKNN